MAQGAALGAAAHVAQGLRLELAALRQWGVSGAWWEGLGTRHIAYGMEGRDPLPPRLYLQAAELHRAGGRYGWEGIGGGKGRMGTLPSVPA